jgi:uncharacterized membrane protein YhdT
MDKIIGAIESFLYEISAYFLPGYLVLVAMANIFKKKFNVEYVDLILYEIDNFSFLEWAISIGFIYVTGMIIAAIVFSVFSNLKLLRYFTDAYAMKSVLQSTCWEDNVKEFKDNVIQLIKFKFKIELLNDNDDIKKKSHIISQLLRQYLQENSRFKNPIGRYYERKCLAQNLAFVFLLLNFFQLIFVDNNLGEKAIIFFIGIIIISTLLWYVRIQNIWAAQMKIRRFFVLIS